ncbi:MAG TPA: hypothetical protein VMF30_10240 [Pirellulales bacterium]|nr:hypothetical protein [Pirellulales bacterium]
MKRTVLVAVLLALPAAALWGCGGLAARADDAPTASAITVAATTATATENAAGDAEISLKLREPATALFAGAEAALHVEVQAAKPTGGTLAWQLAAENRTLAAGEIAVAAGETAVLKLRLPQLSEGVSLRTELHLSLFTENAQRKEKPRAVLARVLWLVPTDSFAGRKKWLKELPLRLYDPENVTAKVFTQAEIPFARVASLAAIEGLDDGILIVGEGIDLTHAGPLGDTLLAALERGVPVAWLAPAAGDLPYPATETLTTLRFAASDVIPEIDKRLTAAAWPTGEAGPRHFVPAAMHGELRLVVTREAGGWPWIEAASSTPAAIYLGSGAARLSGDALRAAERKWAETKWAETKSILCGYPIIATWEQSPAARYLLAGIVERLAAAQESPGQ